MIVVAALLIGCSSGISDSEDDSDGLGTEDSGGATFDTGLAGTDADSDTEQMLPAQMCDDTIVIRPPVRIQGDDLLAHPAVVDYEYELTAQRDEGGLYVPSCDTTPPGFPPDRAAADYEYSYGAEIRMEVWLDVGEQVRVTVTEMAEAVYVMEGCQAGTPCVDATRERIPLTMAAAQAGTYVVVVENRVPSGQSVPFDIFVEVLPPEVCGDGVDNDLDGMVDCGDTACNMLSECVDECVAVEFVPPRMSGTRPREIWATSVMPFTDSSCNPNALPSAFVVEMELEQGQRVRATATDGSFGQIVNFSQSCESDRTCILVSGHAPYSGVFDVPSTGVWYATFHSVSVLPYVDFDWVVGVIEQEDCTTLVDEDLDGVAGCSDPDCLFHPECGFECPEATEVPVSLAGADFAGENANLWSYQESNGCFGEGGQDILVAVDALVGQFIEVSSPSGMALPIVNIVHQRAGGCTPTENANACVFSEFRGGRYQVETAGLHYVNISLLNNGYSGPYDWTLDVVSPTASD